MNSRKPTSKFTILMKRWAYCCLLSATIFSAPSLLMNTSDVLGVSIIGASAIAQSGTPKKEVKKRALPTISDKIFKGREKIFEIFNPDTEKDKTAKPDYPLALKETKKLEKRCKDCSPADLAEVYQLFGNIYHQLDKPLESLKYFKKVAAQSPDISVGMELQTLTTITQLALNQEKYGEALSYLDRKLRLTEEQGLEIVADDYFLKSIICFYDSKKKCALKNVNIAVNMVEGRGSVAKESWYNVQRSMYYENEDNKGSLTAMIKLIRHYPKKKYWRELGNYYGLLERGKDQLHAMDAAYVMGAIDKENQLMALAQAYINFDVPYLSARIVEKGMKDKLIERNEDNLTFLTRLWRLAKEPKKAIATAKALGDISKSGDGYGSLVRSYLDINKPKEAVKWGEKALKKGKLSSNSVALFYVDLGSAYFELRQFDKAISMFEKAGKEKKYRKVANSWVGYVKNEKGRYEGLKQSLAAVGVDIEKVLN